MQSRTNAILTLATAAFLLVLGAAVFDVKAYAYSNIDVVQAVNKIRTDKGLPNLKFQNKLYWASKAKAEDMCKKNYWAHETPEGYSFDSFTKKAGVQSRFTGENLAKGFNDVPNLVKAWQNSPAHYANMISPNYTHANVYVLECRNYQGQPKINIVVNEFVSR